MRDEAGEVNGQPTLFSGPRIARFEKRTGRGVTFFVSGESVKAVFKNIFMGVGSIIIAGVFSIFIGAVWTMSILSLQDSSVSMLQTLAEFLKDLWFIGYLLFGLFIIAVYRTFLCFFDVEKGKEAG
jgi:hypothetical protein